MSTTSSKALPTPQRQVPAAPEGALIFYRDSRRPQGWGGFLLALWMAIYIGQALPLWIVVSGALLTMLVVTVYILKFRPLQAIAWLHNGQLTEQRFWLPKRVTALNEPPQVVYYGDGEWLLQYPDGDQQRQTVVVFTDNLLPAEQQGKVVIRRIQS
ncbi:hypothetical protein [Idiomarina xiamenensis]|uniref:Uncharacterized protein n=1 Tax=Idiomarina xiamenensis 10-D-4 TaxID=740709 RepID=K2KAZ3_9GAMM|nr:hypothetical protein [Idiomarina xiamenensis]EKE83707.1 hypothetical protein A10D4_07660 [Idiomarina xiamenensis 10-D-4]